MGSWQWAGRAFFGIEEPISVQEKGQQWPANPGVFVAFDLETTGLYPTKDRIVEIGGVKFDSRGPISRFSVLVDPRMPMPIEASRVNGITDTMLVGKPDLDHILPDFLRFIGDGVLVAHNSSFDLSFVNAALKERWEAAQAAARNDGTQGSLLGVFEENGIGIGQKKATWSPPYPVLPNRVVDTLAYAKEMLPGRAKYSMQELASALGIITQEAHRAEDDARVCMELFIKLAELQLGRAGS